MRKRPVAVIVISCLYLIAGIGGAIAHLTQVQGPSPWQQPELWIAMLSVAAAVAGACMLRGDDWARWLAIAWIAAHVVISAFNPWPQLLAHAVMLAIFAYFLFRGDAAQYFRQSTS